MCIPISPVQIPFYLLWACNGQERSGEWILEVDLDGFIGLD